MSATDPPQRTTRVVTVDGPDEDSAEYQLRFAEAGVFYLQEQLAAVTASAERVAAKEQEIVAQVVAKTTEAQAMVASALEDLDAARKSLASVRESQGIPARNGEL